MKTYISTQPFHDGSKYYKPGEPFQADVSKDKTPDAWTEAKAKDVAAIEASTDHVPDDADLEALTKAPLQAVAFMRHVPGIASLDVGGLRAAIRASYEPNL